MRSEHDRLDTIVCFVAASAVAAIVWALPRPVDDLFVALAGGRDVFAGKLAQPDDWAFTTHGHAWLDQNWGSHVLFYASYLIGGDVGLLVLKAVLLAAASTFIVLAARERGVEPAIGFLVVGGALAAARSYIDLRPNLVSFVMTSLLVWLSYRAHRSRSPIWFAAFAVWIWSNVHGAFVLGIGFMLVCCAGWIATRLLAHQNEETPRPWSEGTRLLLATAVAAVLATFANPFGTANITHALVLAREPVWRIIDEWQPLLRSGTVRFGSSWEFLVVCACWGATVSTQAVSSYRRGTFADLPNTFFDVVAGAITAVMAFQARRFVPLAIVVLAPPIALGVQRIRALAVGRIGVLTAALALAVCAAVLGPPLVMRYRADNPLYPPEGVLERMIVATPFFPVGAAVFAKDNALSGPVFNAWEWEGFLRWNTTRLRFFVGSRAQQAYDAATFRDYLRILDESDTVPADLESRGAHLAIVPLVPRYARFISALTDADEQKWCYVYNDGLHAVLADTRWPANATLLGGLENGTLSFRDEGTRLLSRALYLASPARDAQPEEIRRAIEDAMALRPTGIGYATLGDLAIADRVPVSQVIAFLDAEKRRLGSLPIAGAGSGRVLEARQWIAAVLGGLHRNAGRIREADANGAEASSLHAELVALKTRWGWGNTPGFYDGED